GSNWSIWSMPGNGEKKWASLAPAGQMMAATVFRPSVTPTPDQMGSQACPWAPATICTQIDGAISGYTAWGLSVGFEHSWPPAAVASAVLASFGLLIAWEMWR